MMRNNWLRQANAFHSVVRHGSIAAAARQLRKSPSAVHHDLSLLERELGRSLFVKVGRSLRLAPGASELFDSVARALDDIERGADRFRRSASDSEVIRIAAVSGFGRYRLAPLLFRNTPAAQPVDLVFGSHEQIMDAVASRAVDVGLTYKPVTALPIVSQAVAEEDFVLVAKAGTHRHLSAESLEDLPFVTYDEYEYIFACWFDRILKRQPAQLKRLDHTTELEEALESVACGRGLTIVPRDAWSSGPTRRLCDNVMETQTRCTNILYALSIAGGSSAALKLVTKLLETV